MEDTAQSQTFFLISSIGFVVLWVLVGIALIYIIRTARTFNRIVDKVEKDVEKIGDASKEMLLDLRDSAIFQFIFGKRKGKHRKLLE